jgi:hypothetical protein
MRPWTKERTLQILLWVHEFSPSKLSVRLEEGEVEDILDITSLGFESFYQKKNAHFQWGRKTIPNLFAYLLVQKRVWFKIDLT